MSELRKNLDAAKNDYRAAKYPGDLSEDLLRERRAPIPLSWFLIPAGIAAAVLIGVWTLRVVSETSPVPMEEVTVVEVEQPQFLSIPAMGQFDVAPPSGWSFSAPSFSLIENEITEENPSTTKESV